MCRRGPARKTGLELGARAARMRFSAARRKRHAADAGSGSNASQVLVRRDDRAFGFARRAVARCGILQGDPLSTLSVRIGGACDLNWSCARPTPPRAASSHWPLISGVLLRISAKVRKLCVPDFACVFAFGIVSVFVLRISGFSDRQVEFAKPEGVLPGFTHKLYDVIVSAA